MPARALSSTNRLVCCYVIYSHVSVAERDEGWVGKGREGVTAEENERERERERERETQIDRDRDRETDRERERERERERT